MSARARLYIEELPVHELLSAATYEPQQTPEVKAPCLWRFDHGPWQSRRSLATRARDVSR